MRDFEKLKTALVEEIDDYEMTVFGILGFLNLFRFDDTTRQMNPIVKVWQGRKMRTSAANKVSPDNDVTPDLIIQTSDQYGVVAEVKYSFSREQKYWIDDFKQLISYDDDLTNWGTPSQKIAKHEIVLLPEQGRAVAVREFYERMAKDGAVSFDRNFVIVEFNRADQRQPYLFFRIHLGAIKSSAEVNNRLRQGVKVPIEPLMLHYAKCKLYDAKPPIPYLLLVIWEGVVLARAAADVRFSRLHRNGRIPIELTVDEIKEELSQNYSFRTLNSDSDHQPDVPHRKWLREAIDILVKAKMAEWLDDGNEKVRIFFEKTADALAFFTDIYAEHREPSDEETGQMKLFSPPSQD